MFDDPAPWLNSTGPHPIAAVMRRNIRRQGPDPARAEYVDATAMIETILKCDASTPVMIAGRRYTPTRKLRDIANVLAALDIIISQRSGDILCEKCEQPVYPHQPQIDPLPGVGLYQHDPCPAE